MIKIIAIISMMLISGCVSTKPLVSVQPKIADTAKVADTIKAADEINAVKTEIAEVKGDISAIKEIQLKISAKLETSIDALAGVNNKIEKTQAGRDVVTTQTNDSGLMRYIFGAVIGLCSTLLAILFFVIKSLLKTSKQKKFYKESLLVKVKDDTELNEVRAKHDKFVKGGRF